MKPGTRVRVTAPANRANFVGYVSDRRLPSFFQDENKLVLIETEIGSGAGFWIKEGSFEALDPLTCSTCHECQAVLTESQVERFQVFCSQECLNECSRKDELEYNEP